MPAKAEYLRFENDPAEVWWFEIAERLATPVEELQRRMSYREFVRWTVHLGRKAQIAQLAQRMPVGNEEN